MPKILSNYFKDKKKCVPEIFQTNLKTRTQGVPDILSKCFKNKTQGISKILSNCISKTRHKGSLRYFQNILKTCHHGQGYQEIWNFTKQPVAVVKSRFYIRNRSKFFPRWFNKSHSPLLYTLPPYVFVVNCSSGNKLINHAILKESPIHRFVVISGVTFGIK